MMERIGFCASALCAVHCVVMPFVLAAQPLFHWFRISRAVDNALLALAAGVGVVVCVQSCRQHRDLGPLALLLVGLTAIGIGRYLALPSLIMGGPLVMAYSLWLNRRLCACDTCHHD
jgi:MerC mercury resistance protein